MIPVETVGASDEGYTSSPSASVCSLIDSPSGPSPQWSLKEAPSGTGEPLFPRFPGFDSVIVTPVAPPAKDAARIEQKQQKKGRGLGDSKTREVKWRTHSQRDLSFESHGHGTASSHRRVKIPPMPKSYSLMALNQKFYKNAPLPPPVLSKEEKNANLISSLRNEVTFDQTPLNPPKRLPSNVHFWGFTEEGTVMITLLDERNQSLFAHNQEKIAMWFGQKRFFKLDIQIQKEDVFKRRIVLASIPKRNGGHLNMRAVISDFNDKWIIVDGVDYPIWQRKLSYDDVFYQLKEFNFCPFQLQEVHLEGLEKYEGSPILRCIIKKVERAINQWAEEEKVKGPDFLVLKKIRKEKDGYNVRLEFPETFLDGLSLNEIVMEGMKNFDPFMDYIVTP